MKSFLISLMPVAIQAMALTGRSTTPPPISKEDYNKIPSLVRAMNNLAQVGEIASAADGPHSGTPGTPAKSGAEAFLGLLGNVASQSMGLFQAPLAPVRKVTLEPRFMKTAMRRKVRYGPFDVKANSMLERISRIEAMCTDCTMIEGRSYVENDAGERQNVNTGVYLHHAIMANQNKWSNAFGIGDTCGMRAASTPSLVILGLSDSSDTIYTSPDGSFKAGNYFGPNNKTYTLMSNFANYSPKPQRLWLAVEYEYYDGQPEGFMDAELQFVTVEVCPGQKAADGVRMGADGQFLVPSDRPVGIKRDNFIIGKEGTLINGLGHLHDGGDNVLLSLNGKQVCNSVAHYGQRTDYIATGVVAPVNTTEWATISDMDLCNILTPVKKGDVLSIVANYDMRKHPARKDMHGDDEGLMGIMISQMAVPMLPK